MTTALYWPGRFVAVDKRTNGGVFNGNIVTQKLKEFHENDKYDAYFMRAGASNEFSLYESQLLGKIKRLVNTEYETEEFFAIVEGIRDLVFKYEDKVESELILVVRSYDPKFTDLELKWEFAFFAHKDFIEIVDGSLDRPIGMGSWYQYALGYLAHENDKDDTDLLDECFSIVEMLDRGTSNEYDARFF